MPKSASNGASAQTRSVQQIRIVVMFFLMSGIIFVLASVIMDVMVARLSAGVFSVSVIEQQVAESGALLADQRNIAVWGTIATSIRDMGLASLLFGIGLALVDSLKVQMLSLRK